MRTLAVIAIGCMVLAVTSSAMAQPNQLTGIKVVQKEDPVGNPPYPCGENLGVSICSVFAQFNGQSAQLLSVGFADILASAPWYQNALGGNGPPPCAFIPVFPDLQCDSFVTIKRLCDPGSLGFDPDFAFGVDTLVGGWFDSNPPGSQNDPDANNQVLIMQLAVPMGATVQGTFTLFWQELNPTGEVQSFPAEFSCFEIGFPCDVDPTLCNDGVACTIDECIGEGGDANGCINTPNDALCDDGIECTDDICDPDADCVYPPLPAGTACGDPSDTECDNPDTCDGAGACQDNNEAAGAPCGDQGVECLEDDSCDGMGACADGGFSPSGTACGDATDTDCDNPDSCNGGGVCLDNFEPSGTACGDPSDTDCDNPDSCDGAGACDDNLEAPGTPCGDPSNTECDNPDTCDGTGTCDANYEPPGAACGDQGVECLEDDACDGMGACEDGGFSPAGTACGSPANTDCDNPDSCDGGGACLDNNEPDGTPCGDQGVECREDDFCDAGVCADAGFSPAGTACGDPADTDCDNPDSCDGAGVCDDNLEPAGTACGDPADTDCTDPDSCDGAGVCEDNDAPAGTPCDEDMDVCTIDACNGAGVCDFQSDLDCSDGNDCTEDLCDPIDGCSNPPIPGAECTVDGDCDAGFACIDCLCVLVAIPCPDLQYVELSKGAQGKQCVESLRPVDSNGMDATFVLTARTMIDPNLPATPDAPGEVGSVVIDKFAGVKSADCKGSKEISGKGKDQDEELIITFDEPVPAFSIMIGLDKIEFDKDDPYFFVDGVMVSQGELFMAFTYTGSKEGYVDLGDIAGLPEEVTEIKMRETAGHYAVTFVQYGCECNTDADCGPGQVCEDGMCVPSGECVGEQVICLRKAKSSQPDMGCFPDKVCDMELELLGVTITAETKIQGGAGEPGAVYIDKGAGVKTADCKGSKEISGKGGDQDEQLIFTFTDNVLVESISIMVDKFKTDKDVPEIYISDGMTTYTILKAEILMAYSSLGSQEGIIDFAAFTSVPAGTVVDWFAVRETEDHFSVTELAFGCVEAPAQVCDPPCAATDYCQFETGDCTGANGGVCVEKPFICPFIYDPVCGCDGFTYGNSCEAAAAGMNVDYLGECMP